MHHRYGPENGGFSDYFKNYIHTHGLEIEDKQDNPSEVSEPNEENASVDEKNGFFLFQIVKNMLKKVR